MTIVNLQNEGVFVKNGNKLKNSYGLSKCGILFVSKLL